MKRRKKPFQAEWFGWKAFQVFADKEGIGKKEEEFLPWWEIWKEAYIAGVNGEP